MELAIRNDRTDRALQSRLRGDPIRVWRAPLADQHRIAVSLASIRHNLEALEADLAFESQLSEDVRAAAELISAAATDLDFARHVAPQTELYSNSLRTCSRVLAKVASDLELSCTRAALELAHRLVEQRDVDVIEEELCRLAESCVEACDRGDTVTSAERSMVSE